jgi:hypothetical protein
LRSVEDSPVCFQNLNSLKAKIAEFIEFKVHLAMVTKELLIYVMRRLHIVLYCYNIHAISSVYIEKIVFLVKKGK